ncbi:hypothetical protein PVL29_002327 [Vitis rotundifolia]|uniref:Autophagy protein 5 n=1 Tax=Vitis rotundifolia TaxID=103349 RepID=A0AA39AGN7_VITRO|nr:hypothetical protein PVL29_002327 [Vitis rotundifolia]
MDVGAMGREAQKYVWEGAIPLQIHLHESEVTTLPHPSPALVLAPRMGYLPLLLPLLKPHFSSTLPPGVDTIWFEYKGLPLKWHIPTGVLFDLLCAEQERPWNLTVHFRGYPGNILTPCEGEDSVKWSFINSLKEAAYIVNGNCKNVMNMSQSDQVELWYSVLNGNMEAYQRVSSKLKLEKVGDQYVGKPNSNLLKSRTNTGETDTGGPVKTDKCFTLRDAVKALLPEFFVEKTLIDEEISRIELEEESRAPSDDESNTRNEEDVEEKQRENVECCCPSDDAVTKLKLVRIQGIEPKLEIPFSWVVNNLMNPEHFLHICVCVKVPQAKPSPHDT